MTDLPSAWRARATELRALALEPVARAFETAAAELEAAEAEQADELLTLAEASTESGYSTRRLRELVAAGQVENAGRRGAPRIRRADLPRKATKSNAGGYDAQADAQALLGKLRAV